jgi:hypothetical protein
MQGTAGPVVITGFVEAFPICVPLR